MDLNARKQLIFDFTGCMVAAVTPYNSETGKINLDAIYPYLLYLFGLGVRGVYIMGTTGESFALTIKEKYFLIVAWNSALKKLYNEHKYRMLAIVNISSMVGLEVAKLGRKVCQLPYLDGVALLQPIFYKANNEQQMIGYIKEIYRTCPQLESRPLLYYHFPTSTGEPKFQLESFIETALIEFPQFCAMKFTDTNIVLMSKLQYKFGNRLKIFPGYDETLLAAKTTLGINCGICATFNFEESVNNYNQLSYSVDEGRIVAAQKFQQDITKFCEKIRTLHGEHSFFHSLKLLLQERIKNLDFGGARLPVWIPEPGSKDSDKIKCDLIDSDENF